MAITLDVTVGGASANSFVTAAEMAAYMGTRLNASAWLDADADTQRSALVEAGRELNVLGWAGRRTTVTQAMAWPRLYCPNPDAPSGTTYYDDDVVPQRVKDAQMELAWQLVRSADTDLVSADPTASIIREKTGPLETEWSHPTQRASGLDRFPRVRAILGPLLASGAGQVRLVR